MTPARLRSLTARYATLKLVVVGDFCLDRYLEIDPEKAETSIETGLGVHNVVAVRAQPGAAGTILNNLVALGVGSLSAVGFCGDDGEGYELRRALAALPGVSLDHFITTPLRRTFTYCKPMLGGRGRTARELERFDSKNWTPTPGPVSERLAHAVHALNPGSDGMVIMDQVDAPGTGVIDRCVLDALGAAAGNRPTMPIIADSRRGLRGFPPVIFMMNAVELAALDGGPGGSALEEMKQAARRLANANRRMVFITMAEHGIIGAAPGDQVEHLAALPLRGSVDVVGAGDAVTANLTAALAAGATLIEAVEIAILASSIVIHQLGTTGTASVRQIVDLLPALAR